MEIKARILVVDDHSDLCESIKDVLEENDYHVEYATNGKDAIELTRNNKYDIALIDVKLPDISGNEVVEKIVEISSSMDFIYMTGHATIDSAVEAVKQHHVLSYEIKPLDLDHLLATIKQIYKHREILKALKESEEKYRKLIETAQDAIFSVDIKTGIILDANLRAEELSGIPVKEIVGMHHTQIYPPKEVKHTEKLFKKYVQIGKGITSEDIFVQR